jgi:AraC-like DNA-binding protein
MFRRRAPDFRPDTGGKDPLLPGKSFRIELSVQPIWDYHLHAHSCFELIHIHHGAGNRIVGNAASTFRGGELILVAPHVPHCFYTRERLPTPEVIQGNIVWFSSHLVSGAQGALPELDGLEPLVARAKRGVLFSEQTTTRVAHMIHSLHHQTGAEALGSLYQVLYHLQQDTGATTIAEFDGEARPSSELVKLGEVCEFLRVHYSEPLHLQAVAARFGVSVSTLNGMMKKYLRTTFLKYLTQIRLDAAKARLQSPTESIADVAFNAGFNSLATFNRRFRNQLGMTPQDFRRSRLS